MNKIILLIIAITAVYGRIYIDLENVLDCRTIYIGGSIELGGGCFIFAKNAVKISAIFTSPVILYKITSKVETDNKLHYRLDNLYMELDNKLLMIRPSNSRTLVSIMTIEDVQQSVNSISTNSMTSSQQLSTISSTFHPVNPPQNCDDIYTLLYALLGMTTLILSISMCIVWHCKRIDLKMRDIIYPRGMIDEDLLPEY